MRKQYAEKPAKPTEQVADHRKENQEAGTNDDIW